MELVITDNLTESTILKMIDFVSKQSQYYPKFSEWINDKLHPRLLCGNYEAVIVMSDGYVVGNSIYNRTDDNLELKNFRIDSQYQNRSVGSLLLSHLRCFDKPIVTDITVSNFSAVKFFIKNGFDILKMDTLYIEKQMEYVIISK